MEAAVPGSGRYADSIFEQRAIARARSHTEIDHVQRSI